MVLDVLEKRELIIFRANEKGFNCLLDTGAAFPIWCRKLGVLEAYYPDIRKTDDVLPLSGFGGKGEIAPIVRLPVFCITNGSSSVIFEKFPIALSMKVRSDDFECILPAFIFKDACIEMCYKDGKIRNLQINCIVNRAIGCGIEYNMKENEFTKEREVETFGKYHVAKKMHCFIQD